MITIKNINKIIDILKLVRNSTALMELINDTNFASIFTKEIFNPENISNNINISDLKMYTLYKIFTESGYMNKILDNNTKELSGELAIEYTLDTLYCVLKEYSETKFDEGKENNNEK